MTFGLIGWLKSRYPNLKYEVTICYPSRDKPDTREWLSTNGLGGYSMGTLSGANRRRYHAVLVSALSPPHERRVVLSRLEEVLTIDGEAHELSTNYWASGVVSPTGYKFIESFTSKPCPTWVYEIDGSYLIKQQALLWGTDQVYIGYYWLPDPDKQIEDVQLTCKFLVGFRDSHSEVKGSGDKTYSQFVSPKQSIIMLDNEDRRLCLTWSEGDYESHKQWWWDFSWPVENTRGLPHTEDLYWVGSVTTRLQPEREFTIGASFGKPIESPSLQSILGDVIDRQRSLIERANLDGSQRANMMLLACDQFLVSSNDVPLHQAKEGNEELSVMEGYPWYTSSGRASMITLPGLTLATRRYDKAASILRYFADSIKSGIIASRLAGGNGASRSFIEGADVPLWWGWALYHYYKITRDLDLVEQQLPMMIETACSYLSGATTGIKVDENDGLLRCAQKDHEFSWMDAQVEGIPITPRPGKAVELNALWYSFLETIIYLRNELEIKGRSPGVALGQSEQNPALAAAAASTVPSSPSLGGRNLEPDQATACTGLMVDQDPISRLKDIAQRAQAAMQKFWNEERRCLYDVIEAGYQPSSKRDESMRCNQLMAVSMPFRAYSKDQEKLILRAVEEDLLTPMGIRTLSPSDPSYQGIFGCGLEHPDEYHRDLSRHQGTAYPWLLGQYCEALLNVFGPLPETVNRVRLSLQPLFDHVTEEDCLGSISEMFDGSRPQLPRGCPVSALSVAETMRWYRWIQKQ